MSFRGVKRRGNPLNRNATQWRLPLTALVLAITTAQKIFAIKIRRIRNRTAVSQDCLLGEVRLWRKRINENLFRAFLYTECAYSGCEPQRRREIGAPSIAQTALRLWQPPQMSFRGVKRRGNPLNRNATQWRLPLTALVLTISTAQKIFAISSSRGKTPATIPQDSLLGEVRLWRKRNIPQSKQCFDIIAHSEISSCKA